MVGAGIPPRQTSGVTCPIGGGVFRAKGGAFRSSSEQAAFGRTKNLCWPTGGAGSTSGRGLRQEALPPAPPARKGYDIGLRDPASGFVVGDTDRAEAGVGADDGTDLADHDLVRVEGAELGDEFVDVIAVGVEHGEMFDRP